MKFKVVEENQSKILLDAPLVIEIFDDDYKYLGGSDILLSEEFFSEIIKELKPQEKIIKTMVYEDPYPNHWLLTNSAIYISGKIVKDLNSNQRIIHFIDLSIISKIVKCNKDGNIFLSSDNYLSKSKNKEEQDFISSGENIYIRYLDRIGRMFYKAQCKEECKKEFYTSKYAVSNDFYRSLLPINIPYEFYDELLKEIN